MKNSVFIFLIILSLTTFANAQTEILISGAKTGFPVALPQLCNAGEANESVVKVPEVMGKNLDLSGLFKVVSPGAYIETPGKCGGPKDIAYSDWSVIGAEGVVKGTIRREGGKLVAEMYLHDVAQQKPVVGKRYESAVNDFSRIAHKFSNEIMRYFTGEAGVFGTKIVFVSRVGRFKDLFVMELDGSNLKQITRDRGLALSPAWSPAGDRIVYTSYLTRSPELYLTSINGGNPLRITKRPGLELGAEFDPKGSSLAAAASVRGISKIAQFDLKGRILRMLTDSGSIDVSPSWSPDGSQITFVSNRGGGPQIYTMSSSGGNVKRISFTQSSYCTSPAWSPKGDKITFTCRNGGNQVYVSNTDGSSVSQVTFGGNNEDPSWSPDGRFLVFSSNFGRGGAMNIGILSLLGGAPRQISHAKSEDSQPAWGPLID